jgi:Zn-dependent peptidase ImmA (M78 family)
MQVSKETLDRAEALLRTAYRNAGVGIRQTEIGTLALKIAFAESVKQLNGFKLSKITAGLVGPPTLALAASMASRVWDALQARDVEPLLDFPVLLSEKLGTDILLVDNEDLSGGCILIGTQAFILLPVNRRLSDLFVCAHELGHLLLLSLGTDREGALVDVRSDETHAMRGPREYFADAFAREVLIPAPALGIAIEEIRKQFNLSGPIGDIELLYLSRVFGVSFLVIAKRCERLGLLPEGGAVTLYKILAKEFGGPELRADMLQLPPRPTIDITSVPQSVPAAIQQRTRKQAPKRRSIASRSLTRKLA